MSKTSLSSILVACLGSTLIGSSAVFVRFSDLGPLTTGFYRMLFALPLLTLWMAWEKKNKLLQTVIPRQGYWALLGGGAFFAIDLAIWNWSIDHTTIVNATLFNNTAVFFIPLIMWFIAGQKQTRQFLLSALVGFLGCLLLVGESMSVSFDNLVGDLVALVSGVTVALYMIVIKQVREEVTTGFLMFWTGLICTIFMAIFSWLGGEPFFPLTTRDYVSIFGQSVLVHSMGQGLLAFSLGRIPAAYAGLILFLAPLAAALLGWLVYGEPLSLVKVVGMLLIMGSIIMGRKAN